MSRPIDADKLLTRCKERCAGWNKYPDKKPPRSDVYLVSEYSCLTKNITFVWVGYWDGEKWHLTENFESPDYTDIGKWIYAWMELPEPMQREEKELENVNRCVCCGEIIPEGRMVCPKCENDS